ncbi:unnamed protein product [Medioppia subpectinata]|uniref:Uncharacterized protein n=1 Tax=Medioppia subpectinata TaxID=1979941 RepID=A0A7R9KVJ1_9ACAR|nr:unnamed protein product [Medioppia subpectinata]CAG2110249.1 unnamed protein product [Medioppia subpectinata]
MRWCFDFPTNVKQREQSIECVESDETQSSGHHFPINSANFNLRLLHKLGDYSPSIKLHKLGDYSPSINNTKVWEINLPMKHLMTSLETTDDGNDEKRQQSQIFAKDSLDRFGDDLFEILLSYISHLKTDSVTNVCPNSSRGQSSGVLWTSISRRAFSKRN